MKYTKTSIVAALLLLLLLSLGYSQEKKVEVNPMKAKLHLARQLLASVATEDYEAVEKQSMELAQLTRNAAWLVHRTPEYRRQSVEFERAAFGLASAAKKKELNATSLLFLNVVLSCVECHNYMRDTRDLEVGDLDVPSTPKVPKDQQGANYWMTMKLRLSGDILAALAVENYDTIVKSAETMDTLSRIEGWARRKDGEAYRAQLEVFRVANKDLIRHAKADDQESATLAFAQMTLNCIKCHKHLQSDTTKGR